MGVPGEACAIILGTIIAEIIQQEEGIELPRCAETEGAVELDAGALGRGL
jgi:hypothetical protein